MGSKYKVTVAGLLIFISMQWTSCVRGKNKINIGAYFGNVPKLNMFTLRITQLDFKNTMTCHTVHDYVKFHFKLLYVTQPN